MNESSRAQQFLEHTCTAVSHGNLAYFNNLKRGFDWGINAMFCVTGSPQQSQNPYDDTILTRAYNSMVATVNMLNGDDNFTLSPKSYRAPLISSEYKSRLIQRSGRSCELTGAQFIAKDRCTTASNCTAVHIIPKRMCLLTDGASGVFAWLVLAILLSKKQFDDVWDQCAAQDGNESRNLLLLLNEIKMGYDQAYFKLSYSNANDVNRPLLRRDYDHALQNRERMVMGFEWLVPEEEHRMRHWVPRRISDDQRSILPVSEHHAGIERNIPTAVHYVNFASNGIEDPSPLLLDVHNLMASLFIRFQNFVKPGRRKFPLGPMWSAFVREDNNTSKSNSRQRSHPPTRDSLTDNKPVSSPSQFNMRAAGDLCDGAVKAQNPGKRPSDHVDDIDSHFLASQDGEEEGPNSASSISFQRAIEEYLKKEEIWWIDQMYNGEVPYAPYSEDESSYTSFLQHKVIIPTWIAGLP
ncbi:no signficant blast hit [Histoplasma capsulatum G186AR]|nr:no signficant blast hit [Histoplasma capsulatum]QSS72951.1 no signficant blast hit [Histoplasma capsulatum G186AR]